MSRDILHQLVKGCFKDHLVDRVCQLEHGETKAQEIMDQIDCGINVVPSFPGLRNFKQGL